MNLTRKEIIRDIEDGVTFEHVTKYCSESSILKAVIAYYGLELIEMAEDKYGESFKEMIVDRLSRECEERMKEL